MPDRDKIPDSVPRHFQSVYKQLCELQSPEVIAESSLRPLCKSLQGFGNTPINFIKKSAGWLKPLSGNSLLTKATEWDKEHLKIRSFAEEINEANLDGVELAVRACHHVIQRMECGEQIQDVESEIVKNYLKQIRIAHFDENILLEEHPNGLDDKTIEQHLDLIDPHFEREIEHVTKQLVSHGNVHGVTLPNRKESTVDVLDIDIMQGL